MVGQLLDRVAAERCHAGFDVPDVDRAAAADLDLELLELGVESPEIGAGPLEQTRHGASWRNPLPQTSERTLEEKSLLAVEQIVGPERLPLEKGSGILRPLERPFQNPSRLWR